MSLIYHIWVSKNVQGLQEREIVGKRKVLAASVFFLYFLSLVSEQKVVIFYVF